MLNNKVIKMVIEDLKNISQIDLCIANFNGDICATTFNYQIPQQKIIDFLNTMTNSKTIDNYNFFKVTDDISSSYIVITKGDKKDSKIIGKICVSELKNLIIAYREKIDENTFIKNLILDNIILEDIHIKAQKLNIKNNVNRVAIIVKIFDDKNISPLEMIKHILAENRRDFITSLDGKSTIIIKDIGQDTSYKKVDKVANILLDMLNMELMVKAKISYGTIVKNLSNISKSYKEAKMSMEVGDIFYSGKNVIGYDALGIGRLIYQLPTNLCKIFIEEIFKQNLPENFDDETILTIHKFFENSLNISETARKLYIHRNTLMYKLEKIAKTTGLDIRVFDDALTLKIALMVYNYVKYVDNK